VNSRFGLAVTGLALAALLIASSAAASQPTRGFAAYKLDVTLPSGQHSVLVNETVGQSTKPGFSNLVLQLTGSQQNLTYSRLVNASTDLFPYLSNLASQSFDYSNGTTTNVKANFSAMGTTTVTFQGSQYTLNVYSFAVSASHGNMSVKVNGTLETFPSSLVYSAKAGNGKVSVQAVLVATDLQLTQPSSQTATAAYVGAGLGVGGVALAAVFLSRRRDRKPQNQEQKPPHWVD
jgi:sensor c-di-GMP phosphodiesterase-like protein